MLENIKGVVMSKKEKFVYDRSLRELFGEIPKTLIKLLVNKDIKEVLDISFPKVKERKVDLLTRLEDDTLSIKPAFRNEPDIFFC